ncbi:right-handed parallel beta-helix repeat-containing protein [Rouxiella sp. T17]|uniref:right-handed parallel beta-helix repeat-containing protein n=1 Tax=Rouxiella sp. T17 TaxID=3085684 RepID=UPI002FC77847
MKNNLLPQHCALFPLLLTLPIALSACANTLPLSHSNECKIPSLHGNVSLNSSCVYHQQLVITASHTTLNCQGATLEGSNQLAFGIVVNSKGKPLSDVTIQNCKIHNFTHSGIRITSDIAANKLSADHQENYRRTPTNVKIDNVEVTSSGRVGVYFDDYVTHSILTHSVIRDSYMSGIYLEHSSRNNKIIDNQLINNGHESFGKGKREGLAVDSSAYNLIEGNRFESNGAGGVFLYKNCGEHYSTGKSVIRWQHSDYNVIKNNTFINEPVGIWLASRQNRDLSGFDCGDKPKDSSGKYFWDYADNNLVEGNRFNGVGKSVHDDGKSNH